VYAKLSTNLALALDQPVQVNAYLSPPAARGLDIHFDFHDVVVAQLAGRKRWHVWERLARSERPLKRGPAIPQPGAAELGTTLLDRVLEPGDCVVLPRGFPHAAETVDEASVHLTIGVMTVNWNRLLRGQIDEIASGTALADAVDPSDVAGRAAAIEALTATLGELELRHALASDVWSRQPQTRFRPRVAPQIDDRDRVTVTSGPLLWIDGRNVGRRRKPTLELGDRRLRFPPDCTAFIADVLRSPAPFCAADMDTNLDAASRLVVLQRLAVEGVVARA
jgi:lysine-specific demethylase/histidyl-hydroxylase NO66